MFFPPAVTRMSFLRSVIFTNPSASISAMSPEWSQPSGSSTAAVASGSLKYPANTVSLRISSSPSSASRSSKPGSAGPTLPKRHRSGVFVVAAVVHSVSPYPSRILMPMPSKNSAISCDSGAPPEMGVRSRPPSRSRIFANTSRSASRCCARRSGGTVCRDSSSLLTRRPTRQRPVRQTALHARRLVDRRHDRRVDLLVHARNARQHRRMHLLQRVRRLQRIRQERDRVTHVRPRQVHQPPEIVGERQVEQHQIVVPHVHRQVVDHRRHRVVVAVPDHAALRWAGRARRVDEREQVVLVDRRGGLVERTRMLLPEQRTLRLEPCQVVEVEHVLQARQFRAFALHLRPLRRVLAEHAHRLRVPQDVGHVLRRAVRVHGHADRSHEAERKVEQGPLERRPRQQADSVALAHARGPAIRSRSCRPAPPHRPTRARASGRRAASGTRYRAVAPPRHPATSVQ